MQRLGHPGNAYDNLDKSKLPKGIDDTIAKLQDDINKTPNSIPSNQVDKWIDDVERALDDTPNGGAAVAPPTTPGAIVAPSTAIRPYYPPNRGFLNPPQKATLQPGTFVDRYGGSTGSFASPRGTPPFARALPPGAEARPLTTFEILKPIEVDSGVAAPWFGQMGFGTQYEFPTILQDLIESGHIRQVGR